MVTFAPRKKPKVKEEFNYIHEIDQDELKRMEGRIVFVDPNRRDQIYALSEDSKPPSEVGDQSKKFHEQMNSKNNQFQSEGISFSKFRVTQCMKNRRTGKKGYKALMEQKKLENPDVAVSEQTLFGRTTLSLQKYVDFLCRFSQVERFLTDFYSKTMTDNTDYQPQPLFPKLKLSRFIREQKFDEKIVKSFKLISGSDSPVVAFGDYSAPNIKYHEPMRSAGLLRKLRSKGLQVFLVNEFRSSRTCPSCDGQLEKFQKVDNPRQHSKLHHKTKQPEKVLCHGLLQ